MLRGQSPCPVTSVTQALTQVWSKVGTGGGGGWAGQRTLARALFCRARVAVTAKALRCHQNPLLSEGGLAPSHPLPQSPSCQRWVDLQRNKRELSPGRTPGPEAGARILPVSASSYLTPPTLLDSGRGFRGRVQPGPALLALWGLASRCPGWGQGVPGGRGTLASTALWFRHLLAVPWGPSLGYPISRDEH